MVVDVVEPEEGRREAKKAEVSEVEAVLVFRVLPGDERP